jgi:putative acetyltransferase
MILAKSISLAHPDDFPRLLEVWEASVRATHDFVTEADIRFFKPLVEAGFPQTKHLACIRAENGLAAGFIGGEDHNIDMLFIHPDARGLGAGRRLVEYAFSTWQADRLDVNEQNPQAIGFYLHLGFEVIGRSELDGTGKPYPLLHMQLRKKEPQP